MSTGRKKRAGERFMSRLRELVTRTSEGYYAVHAPTMAAAMSHFALATVAPLGILTIWVSELLRQSSTTQTLERTLFFIFGPQLGSDLARLVVSQSQVGVGRAGGALAALFLLYGAASLFLATQRARRASVRDDSGAHRQPVGDDNPGRLVRPGDIPARAAHRRAVDPPTNPPLTLPTRSRHAFTISRRPEAARNRRSGRRSSVHQGRPAALLPER